MAELITALAVLFVTAGVFLIIANHFSLSPVPFYILAGLVAGMFVEQPELIELAQWGIAFLVFVFGFRVDFAALQSVIRDSEVAAVTQLLIVGPIAFAIGLLFGFDLNNAVYLAIAATLSSTIVGGGLLEPEIRDNLVHGRLASSVHFFDDLLAVGLVLILSADALTTTQVTSQIGFGVIFLLAAVLVYRHIFPLLVRLADDSDELVLMCSISVLIGFIAAAELADVSIVVGAFAAGIAIRGDDIASLGVRNGIESIKDFFVAIFFVTVGALVTIPSFEVLVVSLTLIGLVMLVNPLVMMLAFSYEGYDVRTSFLASTSLNQVSEFSLIIAIQAFILTPSPITETVFEAIILAAAVTMILTSFTRRHEERIYKSVIRKIAARRQTRKIDERSHVEADLRDHVIIVGYGRQGRRIAEQCNQLDHPYIVIENDPVLWDDLRTETEHYVLGDAMSSYPWEKANVDTASVIVSTVDHHRVSEAILDLKTKADIILRTSSISEAGAYLDHGATYVNVPDILASDHLIENIRSVIEGEDAERSLRDEHLETLDTLERYGLSTRSGDD